MLKLSKLFGDHAVLQRNRTIVVWGWCDPFTSVSGTLGTATAAARSGGDGRFTLRFPALPAGGPVKLTVEAKGTGETVSSSDLLIGEVWVASGQSNMQFCAGGTHVADRDDPAGDLSFDAAADVHRAADRADRSAAGCRRRMAASSAGECRLLVGGRTVFRA